LTEESSFKELLLSETKAVLDKASEVILGVIDSEESRFKSLGITDEALRQHPLLKALYR